MPRTPARVTQADIARAALEGVTEKSGAENE